MAKRLNTNGPRISLHIHTTSLLIVYNKITVVMASVRFSYSRGAPVWFCL